MPEPNVSILDTMPTYRERIHDIREVILANAVMFGEIPSPTFGEAGRARFLMDRFTEGGCQNISTDEVGNAVGILPGTAGRGNILLSAHMDTPFTQAVDHTVTVLPEHLVGPGILDNSLGLAVIASLPMILETLGIQLEHDLILLGSTRSLGSGDIEGMRFFLNNNKLPVEAGVIVEGGTLGRLSYTSLGMSRNLIQCKLPDGYDFSRFSSGGAVSILNRIITAILALRIPKEPATQIILGAVEAGTTYNTIARTGSLRYEIRSEQVGLVGELNEQIASLCGEIRTASDVEIELMEVARRHNGGLEFAHPFVACVRSIMQQLEVDPKVAPSTGELAAMIEKGIPGITLGMTHGQHRHLFDERVEIEPIFTGLAQLLAGLQAIDGGICNGEA